MKDLTPNQFKAKLDKYGIAEADHVAVIGYYCIQASASGARVLVYAPNGGSTRRAQLAYLIAEQSRILKQLSAAR